MEERRGQSCLQKFEDFKPEIVEEWKRSERIYAPSGHEVQRVEYIARRLRELGINNAHVDGTGNAAGIPSISAGGDRGGGRDTPEEHANVEPVLEGVKLHFMIGYVLASGVKRQP